MEATSWYQLRNADSVDSPALLIFPDRVRHNINKAIEMVGDVDRLRPHIKTHKAAEPIKMMLTAGISKFKCATIAEAELLGQCDAPDVLLAYQPIGPKLLRFISIIKKYPNTAYACVCDNLAAAQEQNNAFKSARINVPVYIDLNVGMNRTGIAPDEEGIELYEAISNFPAMRNAGIHAYDGHIRSKDFAERTRVCDEAFATVVSFSEAVKGKGLKVPNIVVGGSPSFPIHAKRDEVECSPGTFVYWDYGYADGCPEQEFQNAAVLMTRIVSLPAQGKICTDLGHKSVAAENEISKRVYFLNTDGLIPIGQSEEHLVLENTGQNEFVSGQVLYGLPYHVCPTVALYERAITVQNGMVTGEWKNVARDRKITI